MKLSERDIERTCTDFLQLDDWRPLKTDPVSRREWGKGFGEKGMADHLYIRYLGALMASFCNRVTAQVMWIEWKSVDGKAAPHQLMWHTVERARGSFTLIAGEDFEKSIEGFMKWYRNSGLMRRKI